MLTDIIACPGGDFCALANAKSIPIAQAIQARFDDLDYLHDLGDISLNISGCMNACGHHHIGNIGILGVDKNGSEWYQITLGGAQGKNSALGKVIGPSFSAAEVPEVIEQIIATFVRYRESEELFVDTLQRIGLEPFKEAVYPKAAGGVGMNNLLRLEEGVARIVEDDPWTLVRDLQAPLPTGRLILPLARWLENPRQHARVAGAGR